MPKVNSFTVSSDGILRRLNTNCGISEAISLEELKNGVEHPEIKEFVALWDTGASSSAISQRVVDALGLIPTGRGFSDTAAGTVKVHKYGINIMLPSNVGFSSVEVSCNNMKVDVLLGMDIISKGDFSITNKKGKTIFTFQTPSTHVVDYTEEINKFRKIHESWIKVGNKKCPCRSGKDWDNCHGAK